MKKTISKILFDNVQVKPSLEYKVQLKRLKFEKTSPVLVPPHHLTPKYII